MPIQLIDTSYTCKYILYLYEVDIKTKQNKY